MPFLAVESILLIISFNASGAPESLFCARDTNFFTLVLTALFADLLRKRLSSLLRCRFSAELIFFAKGNFLLINYLLIYRVCNAGYTKSDGRLSSRLHLSHSATFFTFPLSNRVFILISPPQEHRNLCFALVVRLFLLAWAMFLSLK
jgi:hypothetical protein